ncbi:hypothetical protein ACWIUD_08545 [Helicobacter sp. 23-1044]
MRSTDEAIRPLDSANLINFKADSAKMAIFYKFLRTDLCHIQKIGRQRVGEISLSSNSPLTKIKRY